MARTGKKTGPEDKKKAAAASAAIWGCPREEQIDELSHALLREYMHRKGFKKTLEQFDREAPRTEKTVASRALMHDMMHTGALLKGNSARGAEWQTIMEHLCEHRLARRAVALEIEGELAAAQAECEELARRIAELPDPAPEEEGKGKGAEGKKEKKKDKEKKKEKKKDKVGHRSASAPAANDRAVFGTGWQPPGLSTAAQEPPALLAPATDRNRDEHARVGFGGRSWQPPSQGGAGSTWASELRPGASSASDIAKIRQAALEEEQEAIARARAEHEEHLKDLLGGRRDSADAAAEGVGHPARPDLGVAQSMRPVLSAMPAGEELRLNAGAVAGAQAGTESPTRRGSGSASLKSSISPRRGSSGSGRLKSPVSPQVERTTSSKRVTFSEP